MEAWYHKKQTQKETDKKSQWIDWILNSHIDSSGKRVKERTIYDAAVLVLKWRLMSENKNNKISMKQGADIVGVAKKSLDDYLLQLRLGRKYGFDFQVWGSSKIGILRSFNRNKRRLLRARFMPGRKKKEFEEDYWKIIKGILRDVLKVYSEKQ